MPTKTKTTVPVPVPVPVLNPATALAVARVFERAARRIAREKATATHVQDPIEVTSGTAD